MRWTTVSAAALAAALGASNLGYAPVAYADIADDGPLDEVVVTAPLDVSRGSIAQGAAVLSREDLINTMGQGLGETLERQPGVSSTFFGAGASRPIIRGLGEDRVRILSDGIGQLDASSVSPDHAVGVEALEAEEIEILRGPAALAFGGSAIGGVVNVLDGRIAKAAPDKRVSGGVYVSAATGVDAAEAAGYLTLAFGPLVLRAEGFTRDSGDYAVPGFALSAAKRAERTAEELAEGEPPPVFERGLAKNSFAEAQQAALGASLVGDWGFVGLSTRRLESLYGLVKDEKKEEGGEEEAIFEGGRIDLEQTRTDFRAARTKAFGPFASGRIDIAFVDYRHDEIEESGEIGTTFTNEGFEGRVEVTHKPIAGWRGEFGVSGLKTDFAAVGEEAFVTPTEIEDLGAFLVERYERGPFALQLGGRVERRAYDNASFGDRDFTLGSASIAGSWKPTEPLFLGLTVGYTQRAPSEIELFADGPHLATAAFEIGDPDLDVEKALSVEGVARWATQRFTVEASLFRYGVADFIALNPDGTEEDELPVFRFAQADATLFGGELTGRLSLIESDALSLAADASLELVRGEFDAGGNLPRIPPRSVTVGVEGRAGLFGGRVEVTDVAEQDRLAAFETATDGYQILNARLDFTPVRGADNWRLFLDGRNLTDEEARVHTSFLKELLPRPGRSVRFGVTTRF